MTPLRSRIQMPLSPSHRRAGGAVIIIVLTLLATLAFLGFFFYEWTDQERTAANGYATADTTEIDANTTLDQALEQYLVATRIGFENSVLWGNRHSILSHIIGPLNSNLQPLVDHPYSGSGITLIMPKDTTVPPDGVPDYPAYDFDGDGNIEVCLDYNGDGVPDRAIFNIIVTTGTPPTIQYAALDATTSDFNRMSLNFSRVAQTNPLDDAFNSIYPGSAYNSNPLPFFNPAAGYTYPDLNSLFLAYDYASYVDLNSDGTFDDFDSDGSPDMLRISIPSFFRPQLDLDHRDPDGGGAGVTASATGSIYGNGQNGFASMYINANTRDRVLRPHALHMTGDPVGLSTTTNSRFLFALVGSGAESGIPAQSGDTTRIIRPFELTFDTDGDGVADTSGPDQNGNGIPNEMGIFSNGLTANLPKAGYLELDVDTDGDGIPDAIWMDLGLPMITLSDGRQVVPLVAVKITDADALFNVNVHGNQAGLYSTDAQSFGLLYDRNGNGSYDPPVDSNSSGFLDSGDAPGDVMYPVHRSNMGLSPSEINIAWGLMSDPSALSTDAQANAINDYVGMGFSQAAIGATTAAGLLARASVDQMFILGGRLGSGNGPTLPGRHGEPGVTAAYYSGLTPFPARAGVSAGSFVAGNLAAYRFADDDRDDVTSGQLGYSVSDPLLFGIPTPPAVHPLDFSGAGIDYLATGPNGAIRRLGQVYGTNNPSAWPQYDQTASAAHWTENRWPGGATGAVYGILPYTQAGLTPFPPVVGTGTSSLQKSGLTNEIDEDDEIVANSSYLDSNDDVFGPSEIAGLQLPEPDYQLSGERSRLRDLASFNLRDSNTAQINRKRFTTDSWSRQEWTYNVTPNEDANGNGTLDSGEDRNGNGTLDVYPRGWEYNAWGGSYTAPNMYFPPRFPNPTSGSSVPFAGDPLFTNDPAAALINCDPYRWELRLLLMTKFINDGSNASNFDAKKIASHLKLNINRLLVGMDSNGSPLYRQLTPHPVFQPGDTGTLIKMFHGQHVSSLGETQVPTGGTIVFPIRPDNSNYNSSAGRYAQEWWARYDRQRMARDIYVMLWTLSGGNDFNNYATTRESTNPPDADIASTPGLELDSFDASKVTDPTNPTMSGKDRCREMAQFAVNLVDALDRDDVITKFEYDENLTDGWDVSQTDGTAGASLQAVYGVEAAQLTFSEGLAVQTSTTNKTGIIEYNDATNIHYHTFLELRNASPFNVPINDSQWRIRRIDLLSAMVPKADLGFTIKDSKNGGVVYAGDLYLIGSQDGDNKFPSGNRRPSDLRINYDTPANGTFDSIVPNNIEATPPTAGTMETAYPLPQVDLDLFHVRDLGVNVTAGADNAPAILDRINGPSTDSTGTPYVMFALERRQTMNDIGGTAGLSEADNPWIEVDRLSVPVRIWNPDATPIPAQVQLLTSVERKEIYSALLRPPVFNGTDPNIKNTMPNFTPQAAGAGPERNSQSTNPLKAWQPQFDRDFSSTMELLSLPLYGYYTVETPGSVNDQNLNRKVDGTIDAPTALDLMSEYRMFRVGGPTKNLLDTNDSMSGHRVAAIRFQYPEPTIPTNLVNPATKRTGATGVVEVQKHYRNRWHRLLEFVDVPDRSEESIANRLRWPRRVPGKLNLNTIRDEPVMAGLIDDPIHLAPQSNYAAMTNDLLDGAGNRNWFRDLRQWRDGIDPFLVAGNLGFSTSIPIPGGITSQPFRNADHLVWTQVENSSSTPAQILANAVQRDLSVRNTILRPRMIDDDSDADGSREIPDHGLFEARMQIDRTGANGGTGENTVDFHTRQRILAKVENRTTNRSHVFMIWTTIGYFEAHRLSATGEVQIGAQAEDLPLRRAFTVADMTRIEEAYTDPNPNDTIPGSFDFRKFIIYRKLFK